MKNQNKKPAFLKHEKTSDFYIFPDNLRRKWNKANSQKRFCVEYHGEYLCKRKDRNILMFELEPSKFLSFSIWKEVF